jgi:hypothetical protein
VNREACETPMMSVSHMISENPSHRCEPDELWNPLMECEP